MAHSLLHDPERFRLANELHSRPFPEIEGPCRAIFIAIRPEAAEERDHEADRARLIDLIDLYGGAHPPPGAPHHSCALGRGWLRWESHTEFLSYTLYLPGVAETPFEGASINLFPSDWLSGHAGRVVAAAMVRIETTPDPAATEADFDARLAPHFAQESLSVGLVADGEALVASDFRLHEDGFARIAVLAKEGVEPRRLGRVVQRLLEIESYKSLALLSLPVARQVSQRVAELDRRLSDLSIRPEGADGARATLDEITLLAAEIGQISTDSAFRFGAAGAYEAIVNDRIAILREMRLSGRQLYSEFMLRRFDPAMRTCRSAERRLRELSDRVARASTLLSTRVQVAVEAQNQALLESMNRRAALQLRLQQTVEGLSVVAISYYAVNLGAYLAAPFAESVGMDKTTLTSALAIPVIAGVWLMVRSIRRNAE